MKKLLISVLLSLLPGVALAQSTATVDLSTIMSKLTMHEAVGYDIKSGNMTSYTSADILDWKGLSLSAGYSTSSAVVASLDYDLGGFNQFGITSPLLSVVDLRVGFMVGLSNISTSSSSGSAERNKLSYGPEITVVSVKF